MESAAYAGLTPAEFWEMTPVDFRLYMKGYHKRERDRLNEAEAQIKQAWEMTRMQTVTLLNVQLQKKDQVKRPTDLWKFPWDSEKSRMSNSQALTKAQAQQIVEHYRKLGAVT